MPKFVAVVGGKHSGKTTVIQNLIPELKKRGYHVGAIKEMVRIPTLDTPATETDKYRQAGAEIVVAVPRSETVVFIDRRMSLKEIAPFLQGLDFVILEGFETEKTLPKIIAAKTAEEAASFNDGSAIAVSGLILESADEKIDLDEYIDKNVVIYGEIAMLTEEDGIITKVNKIELLK